MLGQGPHSFLKDLASLPNRDFRLRGLNNNFDVNGVPEGEAKGGGGWHNGPALPPHLRRSGSKWWHWYGLLSSLLGALMEPTLGTRTNLGTCQQTGADWWRSGRLPSNTPFEDFSLKKCVSKPKGASHLRPVGLILHFFALHQFNFDFIINFLNSFQFCYISQCFRNSFKPLAFGPFGSVCRDTHK